ncbi:conserved fungal [Cordyceps militaris]|uniref:Conserved fungal n=1 Tax=Cordyceps militaris TaxID=73501 RepID=A0A2H4SM36_CORMI|nr:conserved fungal [Cordyceps militaris]
MAPPAHGRESPASNNQPVRVIDQFASSGIPLELSFELASLVFCWASWSLLRVLLRLGADVGDVGDVGGRPRLVPVTCKPSHSIVLYKPSQLTKKEKKSILIRQHYTRPTSNRPAEHVAPATPPTTLDAQQTNNSTSADLQPPMSAWMPQPGLNLQDSSSNHSSQIPCCSEEHHQSATAGWDHSITPRSTLPGKSGLVYPGQLPQSLVKDGSWGQKSYDQFEFYPFDPDAPIGQAYTTDESIPIIDLRFSQSRHELGSSYSDHTANRRPDSSIGMSTPTAFSDMPATCGGGDDGSTTLSEAPTFSDYGTLSNRTSLMSTTHMSPVGSPRLTPQSRPDQMRAQSRGRASPSPRPSMRSAPYSTEGLRNTTRWSTGSQNVGQGRLQSPFGYGSMPDSTMPSQRYSMQAPTSSSMAPMPHSMVSGPGSTMPMQPSYVPSMPMGGYRNSSVMMGSHMGHQLPTSHAMHHDNSHHSLPQPPTLASHGLLKLLQNNIESQSFHGHYADLSAPPDLYPALHQEPAPPPAEDMNPSDPDLVPYEQELRFDGDMYTPKWVRGHGNKREGWCGICKPGRWLVLKNSAYWYDKSFTHGISAATGAPFQEPLDKRRMDGNPDVWEGLCGSCNKWIALVSSKKKGTTWFRHAYKCHSHAKIKDTPKRRRDQVHNPRMPGPPLSSMGLGGLHDHHQRPGTPPLTLPHGLSTASYASMGGGGINTSIPQYMHPQQHHPHHHQALGPLTPPQSLRSSVGRTLLSSPATMYGNVI